MLLKKLLAATRSVISPGARHQPHPDSVPAVEYPLETEQKLNTLHGRAPVQRHLDILFQDARIGPEKFTSVYQRCLLETGTAVTPFNIFQRYQTRHELLQYFLATLPIAGARAECGAYRGATALLLCHAQRAQQADFRGEDFYLIDSFSGTSNSVEPDLIPVRQADGSARQQAFFPVGKSDTSPDLVRSFFADYPGAQICAGWIPQVFAALPEREWAFVHLDLTLFEPTLAALEYFYPRLRRGGVIFCDGSIFCPGAHKAWEQFCTRHDIPFIVLGHRETIIVR
jgi:hypothetical protein